MIAYLEVGTLRGTLRYFTSTFRHLEKKQGVGPKLFRADLTRQLNILLSVK